MEDQYPRGKLCADDDGKCQLGVTTSDRTVIIEFDRPMTWVGMSGDQAMELANVLIKRAREAGLSKPATIAF